uniref:Kelch domain containing 1 n=1 Tax=Pygocentrus nattereri TaxID=42514 RepID=A0AAR2LKU3_PYGNA
MASNVSCRTKSVACERSGHTAVVSENVLFVWGGYVSVADHEVFLPNDEIWLYDLESGLWEKFNMGGEIPPSMSGSCGCILNGHMYIFGGCGDTGQTNEHYSVNLHDDKYCWKKIRHHSGLLPTPRDKLSCWVYKSSIIYFGGYGHKLLRAIDNPMTFIVDEASWVEDIYWGWNNEVHVFDSRAKSWNKPKTFGQAPAPRAAHASATIGNKGYVCGGRKMETRTSDIHCLDLDSWTWTEIVPTTAVPLGRSWHTLTAVLDTSLFLFGGLSVDSRPLSNFVVVDGGTVSKVVLGGICSNSQRVQVRQACIIIYQLGVFGNGMELKKSAPKHQSCSLLLSVSSLLFAFTR